MKISRNFNEVNWVIIATILKTFAKVIVITVSETFIERLNSMCNSFALKLSIVSIVVKEKCSWTSHIFRENFEKYVIFIEQNICTAFTNK